MTYDEILSGVIVTGVDIIVSVRLGICEEIVGHR